MASLNWTRWRTGSQCSCHRTGDMWSRRWAPVIRRAMAFWTAWSGCISHHQSINNTIHETVAVVQACLHEQLDSHLRSVDTVSIQLGATDAADGTLIDTYCWHLQTWWTDYRWRRRGHAHSPLLSLSMTGPVCSQWWCLWLAVFRPTRWRLSSLDWDGGNWSSATLTCQQHSEKTNQQLPLLQWLECWRKPGSRQRTGVVCGRETLRLPCTNWTVRAKDRALRYTLQQSLQLG